MLNSATPSFALVTDRGLFGPTLFTAWGILRHLSRPGTLHFWGEGLTESEWQTVRKLSEQTNPAVTLQCRELDRAELADATSPTDHISGAAMGRLLIPSHISGRVLYIDGDTRVTRDLAPLFDLDIDGKPIAAVRDFVVSKWCARGLEGAPEKKQNRIDELRGLLGRDDISEYFNSGVLLLDCDAICADVTRLNAMQDVLRASACPWGDQDHLNNVFSGQVHLLNPAWNSSWSRTAQQRRQSKALGGGAEEIAAQPDAIIHFHGPNKPWKTLRRNPLSRRNRAAWFYRRDAAVLAKELSHFDS
ncbi:lipopolysaccharide 3-alpha-galactosyltransferase [Thioclava sp. BHET1]|nr:lipopolysaccharide 3-alpha-galactosyltransferase [Thioclava sp. BHET1]